MSIPADPLASTLIPSRWQTAYLRYRELERELTDSNLRVLLRSAAVGRHSFRKSLAEYRAVQRRSNKGILAEPPRLLIRELRGLADLRSSYKSVSSVFEDVYHLAFDRLESWRGYNERIPLADQCLELYRGQRVENWGVEPSIYRGVSDGPKRRDQLHERAIKACQLGHNIAQKLGVAFVDGMAIAQHYSAELGVPTWLADFTRDPWVGLFFATDGGKTGDCGIVWHIMPSEYARVTAGDGNPIGFLQLVVPSGIPRIENQAGVFIVASRPEFFDQYVPFGRETRFRQVTGLTFEDPILGITRNKIYPSEDSLRIKLAEMRGSIVDCGCIGAGTCSIPPSLFSDPSDPKTYEGLLTCWLNVLQTEHLGRPEPSGVRALLPELARFHAHLHSEPYAARLPRIVSRSFNRLRHALENMYFAALEGEQPSLENAVKSSYLQVYGDREHDAALFEVLSKISSDP